MALAKDCLLYFANFIEAEIGIIYTEVNYYQLESRLEDIAKQLGFADVIGLWDRARNEGIRGELKNLLVDVATNNETSFFRDPNVFQAITTIVKNAAPANTYERPFKIWSCACSTGQELYSLAMLLAEFRARQPFYYNILATDISERVLRRAQKGVYSQLEVQRGLNQDQLSKYFRPEIMSEGSSSHSQSWVVKSELMQNLSFQKLNLLESWRGIDTFQLILCRNVLIYQTVENKKKILTKLYEHLAPGGYLILGGAESLIGLFDRLDFVPIDGTVVYYKRPLASTDSQAV